MIMVIIHHAISSATTGAVLFCYQDSRTIEMLLLRANIWSIASTECTLLYTWCHSIRVVWAANWLRLELARGARWCAWVVSAVREDRCGWQHADCGRVQTWTICLSQYYSVYSVSNCRLRRLTNYKTESELLQISCVVFAADSIWVGACFGQFHKQCSSNNS